MSTKKIAEVLAAHQIERGHRDLHKHCTCGWVGKAFMADDFISHQAEMVAAALEPFVRERERAAWGRGWQQGADTHCDADDCDITDTNPYREES